MISSVQPKRDKSVSNRREDTLKEVPQCSNKCQASCEGSRKLFQATVNHNIRRIEKRLSLGAATSPTTSTRNSVREWRKPAEVVPRRSLDESYRTPVLLNNTPKHTISTPVGGQNGQNYSKRILTAQNERGTPHKYSTPRYSPNTTALHPGLSKCGTAQYNQGVSAYRRPTMVVACTHERSRVKNVVCPHNRQGLESAYSLCTECEPSLVSSDCSCCGNPPLLHPYTLHHVTTLKRGERLVYIQRPPGSSPKSTYLGGICKRLSPTFTRLFQHNQMHLKGILHDQGQPVLQQPGRNVTFDNKGASSGGKVSDTTSMNFSMWKALMCGTCFEMAVDDDGRSSVNTGESGSDGDDGSDGGGGDDDADADADQGDSASDIEAIEYSSDGGGSSGASSVSNDGSAYQEELMNEEMYHQDYGNDTEMDEMDFLYRDQPSYCDDLLDGYSYADEEERIRGYTETCRLSDAADHDQRMGSQLTESEEFEEISEFYFDRYR